jgi:spore maturation protein CgeB
MRFIVFAHSLVSDWNHGNAHFLRGVMRELVARGHEAVAFEPEGSWSRANLEREQGSGAAARFAGDFPELSVVTYGADFDPAAALDNADVVIVHEWNEPELIGRIGGLKRAGGKFRLLFHDTHHRAVSQHDAIAGMPLEDYDAVLAFGAALRERYDRLGWGRRVFTWHEAADVRAFHPLPEIAREKDLIWIGNWGDGERAEELAEFLIAPARRLGLTGTVHGVRYPPDALALLKETNLAHQGWIANADAPKAFARHRMTVHVPRRPYVEALPGIPTIRVFEALAAGIPLISAPWEDVENLFRPGQDFLIARTGGEMERHLQALRSDPDCAAALTASGLATIRDRHTCAHRVDELFAILASLDAQRPPRATQGLETVA